MFSFLIKSRIGLSICQWGGLEGREGGGRESVGAQARMRLLLNKAWGLIHRRGQDNGHQHDRGRALFSAGTDPGAAKVRIGDFDAGYLRARAGEGS